MTYASITALTILGLGSVTLFVLLYIVHWIFRLVFFGIRQFLEPIYAIFKRT